MHVVSFRTRALVVSVFAGVAAAAIACGGGDDSAAPATPDGGADEAGDPGPGSVDAHVVTPTEACVAYYLAACERYRECGIGTINCDDYVSYCPDVLFAEGLTRTVESTAACAETRRHQSCEDIIAGISPPCAGPGLRPAGAPCHFLQQCASSKCSAQSGCGVCLPVRPPNSGCPSASETCGDNMSCVNPDAGCAPIAPITLALGAACPSGAIPCPHDAPCTGATPNAPSGTCAPRPAAGAPCAFPIGSLAICRYGSSCVRPDEGGLGVCTIPGEANAPCGSLVGVGCAPAFFCSAPDRGTCQPPRAANERCGASGSNECRLGLFCEPVAAGARDCHPVAAVGAVCGTKTAPGGGSYTMPCGADATCESVPGDAGPSPMICRQHGKLGDPCDGLARPCYGLLQCGATQRCELAKCLPDGGPG